MFALPDQEITWNITVMLPLKELEVMETSDDVLSVFMTLLSDACQSVIHYPVNICSKVLLMGDASHAMHPFSTQGMNTVGLENVSVLIVIVIM